MPRVGAPDGPAGTYRPSRARNVLVTSSVVAASFGTSTSPANRSARPTSPTPPSPPWRPPTGVPERGPAALMNAGSVASASGVRFPLDSGNGTPVAAAPAAPGFWRSISAVSRQRNAGSAGQAASRPARRRRLASASMVSTASDAVAQAWSPVSAGSKRRARFGRGSPGVRARTRRPGQPPGGDQAPGEGQTGGQRVDS